MKAKRMKHTLSYRQKYLLLRNVLCFIATIIISDTILMQYLIRMGAII